MSLSKVDGYTLDLLAKLPKKEHNKTKPMKRNDGISTSLVSEFYVVSNLWRLGYEVALTIGHTKEIDIFGSKGNRKIRIDVKGIGQPPFLIKTIEDYAERQFLTFVWWREFNNIEKAHLSHCSLWKGSEHDATLGKMGRQDKHDIKEESSILL